MSDIEEFGDDAIWVPMTRDEIEEVREDARRSDAIFDALIEEEKRNGTWKPLITPLFDDTGEESVPY